jgi:hypothetical protein
MWLSHPASKTGKPIERDLTLYPMVMKELSHLRDSPSRKSFPESAVSRQADYMSGPIVISELTGRPWKNNNFRDHWRRSWQMLQTRGPKFPATRF